MTLSPLRAGRGQVRQLAGRLSAALFFAALLSEGVLRLAGVKYSNFYRHDARRGWALVPGAEGRWQIEGESDVKINSQGLRDKEHAFANPAGVVRIAVLGDSFAEALQVPRELAFWSVLEKKLARCPTFATKQIEVINFGVSAYGTVNEYITLQDQVWKYSPEIVITAFFTGNDVVENSPALGSAEGRPYYRLEDGRLEIDLTRIRHASLGKVAIKQVIEYSRVFQVARHVYYSRMPHSAAAAQIGEVGLDDAIYRPPATQAWQEAWALTRSLLLAMRNEAQAHGAELWVATLSNSIQVDPSAERRNAFMTRSGIKDLFYPDFQIARLGREDRFHTIILAPRMQAYAIEHNACLHGFSNSTACAGHWNAEGHRVAGELLAEDLCNSLGK